MKAEPLKGKICHITLHNLHTTKDIKSAVEWLKMNIMCEIDLFKLGDIEFWDLEHLIDKRIDEAFEDVTKGEKNEN